MRRIDVLMIGIVGLLVGGGTYVFFQNVGFDSIQAGLWTQFLLVLIVVGWLVSYLFRASHGNMTYHEQIKHYGEAVLQKRLEAMTPEELEALQAKIDAEQAN